MSAIRRWQNTVKLAFARFLTVLILIQAIASLKSILRSVGKYSNPI